MVRNDPQRCAVEITATGCSARGLDQRNKQVCLVIAMHTLQHGGETLKPHPGIHGRFWQRGIVAVCIAIELHEDQIPDLYIAVTIGLRGPRRASRYLGAMIVENLATRSARAGVAHGPEIIANADACKTLGRNPHVAQPDICSLVIFIKYGDPEFFGRQTISFGQQCPGVLNSLALEVVAKAEIAQHLEKGVMPGRVADIIEIVMLSAGANTPLGGHRPVVSPFVLPQKDILELHHTGIGKKQRGIVMGHQRAAGHDFVPVCSEVIKELLSDVPSFHSYPVCAAAKTAVRQGRCQGKP